MAATINSMADLYDELLDSTIQNLRALKAQGTRFVAVSPERLERLTARSQTGRPAVRAAGFGAGQAGAHASKPAEPGGTARSSVAPPAPAAATRMQAPLLEAESHESTAPASAPVLTAEAKAVAFAELRQRAMACLKCEHLASSRKQVVFGVGDINAQLMFIGEAPGADEDAQGEPFVGKAGQLLTKIIQTMGLSRETVYIANILKCRPDMPPRSTGNRKPTPEEMQTCIPYLHEQIDLIGPKVIVALGATAVEGLLGKTIGITRLRGHWQTYRGIPLMPTYHPAYLLRNQAPSEKRRVWEDMLQVMEKLQMPISERQRQFFLKNNG